MLELDSAIHALRWCEHGETVRAGETSKGCSGCVHGICGAALACMQPDPEQAPKRPRRRLTLPVEKEAWGRVIGAALGLAGTVFFANAVMQYLNSLPSP
jgi:hypothetical protein